MLKAKGRRQWFEKRFRRLIDERFLFLNSVPFIDNLCFWTAETFSSTFVFEIRGNLWHFMRPLRQEYIELQASSSWKSPSNRCYESIFFVMNDYFSKSRFFLSCEINASRASLVNNYYSYASTHRISWSWFFNAWIFHGQFT